MREVIEVLRARCNERTISAERAHALFSCSFPVPVPLPRTPRFRRVSKVVVPFSERRPKPDEQRKVGLCLQVSNELQSVIMLVSTCLR